MIFVTSAECSLCGRMLNVYAVAGPGEDGDLYLEVTRNGIHRAQAMCKNKQLCDQARAVRDGPAA